MGQRVRSNTWATLAFALAVSATAPVGCSGGGGGGGGGAVSAVAPLPARAVLTTGGEGTRGDGGDGGSILVVGRQGGDVRFSREGAFEETIEPPTLRPTLGPNPRTISNDTTITVDGGTIFGSLDPSRPASGLHVRAGANLTLLTTNPEAPVTLELDGGGLIVEGALHTRETGLALSVFGGVYVEASGRIVSSGFREPGELGDIFGNPSGIAIQSFGAIVNEGTISARGQDRATGNNAGDAGAGGTVFLATLQRGSVLNPGTIDVSGGRGRDRGGDAGFVVFASQSALNFVGSSGAILARGGEGGTAGGRGGLVFAIGSQLGSLAISGMLDISGGKGNGIAEVEVPDPEGEGTILALRSGGDGGFLLVATLLDVRLSGRIIARGGDGVLDDQEASGGAGGFILAVSGASLIGGPTGDVVPGAGVALSADIDTRGGRGARGGAGGPVVIVGGGFNGAGGPQEVRAEVTAAVAAEGGPSGDIDTPTIVFAGYDRIDASGGRSRGGRGGDAARNLRFNFQSGSVPLPLDLEDLIPVASPGVLVLALTLAERGGSIASDVPVTARGGASVETEDGGGDGGTGGGLLLVSGLDFQSESVLGQAPITWTAAVDLRGGAGVVGGRGGFALAASPRRISLAAPVDVSGGAGSEGLDGPGEGGGGGLVAAICDGAIETVTLTARGGDGASGTTTTAGASGGEGGLAALAGATVQVRGDILCSGGAGVTGGDGGTFDEFALPEDPFGFFEEGGGEGGVGGIALLSTEAPTHVVGRLSVAGGAGLPDADGAPGRIQIDGHDLTITTATATVVLP